jgi:hypothetical protein
MRLIVIGVCLFAAGCSGQSLDSAVSPSARPGVTATQSDPTRPLPLEGSFTFASTGVVAFPTLSVTGTMEGVASQLGRFTVATTETVDLPTATGTGTYIFTAANGDQLSTTVAGGEVNFTPPNLSTVELAGTIVGGTGRFDGATGTFRLSYTGAIDFASGSSVGKGSFEGYIALKK